MSAFGFDASALRRLALGLGFCAAAVALVALVEARTDERGTAGPEAAAKPARAAPLAIESTYPVASWTVSVDGAPVAPEHADATSWNGRILMSSDSELLVVGAGASADGSVNRCLRLRIGDAEPRLVWGGGDVTATVALP